MLANCYRLCLVQLDRKASAMRANVVKFVGSMAGGGDQVWVICQRLTFIGFSSSSPFKQIYMFQTTIHSKLEKIWPGSNYFLELKSSHDLVPDLCWLLSSGLRGRDFLISFSIEYFGHKSVLCLLILVYGER